MKVVQIVTGPHGNIIALTATGEVFNGNFIDRGHFQKPEFMWRKLPALENSQFTIPHAKEPTQDELDTIQKGFEAQKKYPLPQMKRKWFHRWLK